MIVDSFEQRWSDYAASHVRIRRPDLGTIEVQPRAAGTADGRFPGHPNLGIHLLTAHNPGRKLDVHENKRRQQRLADCLAAMAGLTIWDASGGDPAWQHCEPTFAVLGLDDAAALSLAKHFDQEAIFVWTATQWVLQSCLDAARVVQGWCASTA